MRLKNLIAALAMGALTGGASAAVLSFDKLTALAYGDTEALLESMYYDVNGLNYVESGFVLTLTTPNAAFGAAHIGDGSFEPQTFNWHDGRENGWDSYLTLRRVGGGLFNLIGFDYAAEWSAVSADGSLAGELAGAGSWNTALNGIAELRLSSGAWTQLDNIAVEEANTVPLPGTLALLLGGLGAGMLVRRRRH
jgi:hypothetical protein